MGGNKHLRRAGKRKKDYENQKNLLNKTGQRLVLLQSAGDGLRALIADRVAAEPEEKTQTKVSHDLAQHVLG